MKEQDLTTHINQLLLEARQAARKISDRPDNLMAGYTFQINQLIRSLRKQTSNEITFAYKLNNKDCTITANKDGVVLDIISIKFGQIPESIIEIKDLSTYSSFEFIMNYSGTISIWQIGAAGFYSDPFGIAHSTTIKKGINIKDRFTLPEYLKGTKFINLNNIPLRFNSYTSMRNFVSELNKKNVYINAIGINNDMIYIQNKVYSEVQWNYDEVIIHYITEDKHIKVYNENANMGVIGYNVGELDNTIGTIKSPTKLIAKYLTCLIKSGLFLPTMKRIKEIIKNKGIGYNVLQKYFLMYYKDHDILLDDAQEGYMYIYNAYPKYQYSLCGGRTTNK